MPQLSVIVPVYNEEKTILRVIGALVHALAGYDVDYIIVNDGSTDDTEKLLSGSPYSNDSRFTIIHQDKNQGKGSAIRAAIPFVRGDYVIVQDADLEYDPNDIPKLLAYASEHQSPVVYGSRNLDKKTPHGGPLFYWGGRLVTGLANILFHQKLTDEPCGYKLFSANILRSLPLTCRRFEFCPEATALIGERGVAIPEISVHYSPRGKEDGKKINYLDGLSAIYTLLRIKCALRKEYWQAMFIFLFAFGIFFLTWNSSVAGYEPDTVAAAIALTHGSYLLVKAWVGSSLLYVPFVYGSWLLPSAIRSEFLTLVPPFYSAVTMMLLFLIANRLGFRRWVAIVTTMLVTVGSLVWPYSKIGMEYQEMFFIGIILLALLDWSKQPTRSPLGVGVSLALLSLTKSYGIVFVLPTVVYIVVILRRQNRLGDFFRPGFLFRLFAPTILAVICLAFINLTLAGRLSGDYKLGHEFEIVSWWEGMWGIFFSFGKSILIYSPLLIPSLYFWPRFYKKYPAVALFVLIGFVLYFFITAPFSFWSDETPSVRKLVPLIPYLHLPLFFGVEYLWEQKKKFWLAIIGFVVVVAVYVQLINALYPYYRYLLLMRGNLDTLEQMRYNPEVSEIYIDHRLFISYLAKKIFHSAEQFRYTESTWMRHYQNSDESDVRLVDLTINLNDKNEPSVYFIIARNKHIRDCLFIFEIVLLVGVGGCLAVTALSDYRQGENSINSACL